MTQTDQHPLAAGSVAVIGAGNIGSQLVTHLARLSTVRRLVIVDPDSYCADNISQEFDSADIGQKKALASARRAREIRRDGSLQVEGIVARVENVPWGRLRADVICGCVDSRLARSSINQIAWRLGVSWIDAGIQAQGSLVRVQVHVPGLAAPCLECGWSVKDRELIGQAYSCDGLLKAAAPTGASSSLGGVAASLQAIECEKILNRTINQSLVGRQIIIEAAFNHCYVNVLRRNPGCGFDHQVWSIQKVPPSILTVGDLMEHGRKLFGGKLPAAIGLDRKSWLTRLICHQCGRQVRTLRIQGRIEPKLRACAKCGGEMRTVGFYLRPRLELRRIADRLLARPLRRLGLSAGDVVTLTGDDECRQQIELSLAEEPGRS